MEKNKKHWINVEMMLAESLFQNYDKDNVGDAIEDFSYKLYGLINGYDMDKEEKRTLFYDAMVSVVKNICEIKDGDDNQGLSDFTQGLRRQLKNVPFTSGCARC